MNFNVLVVWPSGGNPRSDFALSLARLATYFMQVPVLPGCRNQSIAFECVEGSSIAQNREMLVRIALDDSDMTHLLWIDDDMGFAADSLHIAAQHRLPIIAANYRMRVPPCEFVALKPDKSGRIETTHNSSGLEESCFSGLGFCLIERQVLEALPEPRFPVEWNPTERRHTTDEVLFFANARSAGFPCKIDHDLSKRVWHSGNARYFWSQ